MAGCGSEGGLPPRAEWVPPARLGRSLGRRGAAGERSGPWVGPPRRELPRPRSAQDGRSRPRGPGRRREVKPRVNPTSATGPGGAPQARACLQRRSCPPGPIPPPGRGGGDGDGRAPRRRGDARRPRGTSGAGGVVAAPGSMEIEVAAARRLSPRGRPPAAPPASRHGPRAALRRGGEAGPRPSPAGRGGQGWMGRPGPGVSGTPQGRWGGRAGATRGPAHACQGSGGRLSIPREGPEARRS